MAVSRVRIPIRCPAQDCCRNDGQFCSLKTRRIDGPQPARKKDSCYPSGPTAKDERHQLVAHDVDAGEASRFGIASDGIDPAAHHREGQDKPDDGG